MRSDDFEEEYDEEINVVPSEEDEEQDEDNLEEGFMRGYEQESRTSRCANCKSIINEEAIEEEFAGFTYIFCSQECLKEFEKKQK